MRTQSLLEVAWRNRFIVAAAVVVCVAAAFAYLQTAVPLYTSTSRIYVEQVGPQILDDQVRIRQPDSYLYTQAELLRSTPVLCEAAESTANRGLKSFQDASNRTAYLKEKLDISVGKKDDIIDVSLETPYPRESAQLVNSVVDAYITKYAEQKRSTAVEVLRILRAEKQPRDIELEQRRDALQLFREENADLTITDQDGNVITRRFAQLSDELTRTQLELVQAKATNDAIILMYNDAGQHAKLFDAGVAQGAIVRDSFLQHQIHTLELQLATEEERFGQGHPKVKVIKEPLDELHAKARKRDAESLKAYVDTFAQEYALLENKEKELQQTYDEQLQLAMKVNTKFFEYLTLKDALARTEKLCDILDDRIKELNVVENVGALNISVLEVAQPGEQTSPQKARVLGLGLMAGLMLGCGLALLRDFLDHRLRSADEITAVLELPLLGVLSHLKNKPDRSFTGRIVEKQPRSPMAESFRTLRTAIYFGLPDGQAKTILVTSPSSADGKSTVASNLAIAMAQAGQSVLVVDADFRKPMMHNIFDLEVKVGLSNVLTQQASLEDAIVQSDIERLSLLPCGPIPLSPSEMLNSEGFRRVLEELSGQYDKIIIDSPPIIPVADARILGALCDITLLVLRAEKSTRRHSVGARNELLSVGSRILGVVVNDAPQNKLGYGYGRYGYGRYGYSRYGSGGSGGYGTDPVENGQGNGQSHGQSKDSSPQRSTTPTLTDKS